MVWDSSRKKSNIRSERDDYKKLHSGQSFSENSANIMHYRTATMPANRGDLFVLS